MIIKKIILGAATFLFLYGVPNGELRAAQLVDGIKAIVGSDIILLSEIRAREAVSKGRFRSKQQMTRSEILEELIDERLLRQELDRIGVEATPREIDQTVRGVLAQNRITLSQLKRELAAKGIPWEAYQKDLAERIRIMKFMGQKINSQLSISDEDFELYHRRYPRKSKRQSKEEIKQAILEVKAREKLKSYIRGIRDRTYVEIKDLK